MKKITLKIEGMHCTACAMDIDGELEDTNGVTAAETSYAKATTLVSFDPAKVSQTKLKQVIESLDYAVTESV